MDVSDVQLKVLTLSRQFIATIGTFEATRFFIYKHLIQELEEVLVYGFPVIDVKLQVKTVDAWRFVPGS